MSDAVTSATFTRGSIITSYAHVEYLLADLCLQAWKTSDYKHLSAAFPYKTDTRIKAVRALLDSDGLLKPYRADLQPVLDDLFEFEEIRHFVAHGVMVVRGKTYARARIEFRLFRQTKKGLELGKLDLSAAELEEVGIKISTLLHTMLVALHRIYPDLGYEMET